MADKPAAADLPVGESRGLPRADRGYTGLAPWPAIDKFPVIIGSNITFSYAAATMRMALNGYRANFVDMLGELLDHEPHAMSAVTKRVLGVAGARQEIIGADVAPGTSEEAKAEEIRSFVAQQIRSIPHRTSLIASLLWAVFYGPVGAENHWSRGTGWTIDRASFIHSRRLSYPSYGEWELHVWDQGSVVTDRYRSAPTNGVSGLRISDYPGKFIIHKPQLRAEYPTREGLGRIMVSYMLIKRLIVRMSAQDFERFGKPWVIAYLSTTDTGKPRAAGDPDKAHAEDVMAGIGTGSLAGATLPDSVKLELLRAATELDQDKFLHFLDGGISKLAVGQTFTMEPGKFGSKGASSAGKVDALELARFDAATFCETMQEGWILPLVSLNFPGCEHLAPTAKLHVEEAPDPAQIMALASSGAALDMPIDADNLAEEVGLTLIPKTDEKEVRRLRPIAPMKAGTSGAGAGSADSPDDQPGDDTSTDNTPPDAE